jgi:L-2-hydroxycarboxylate dehydrogenase (NAD+)
MNTQRHQRRVPIGVLREFLNRILLAAGCEADDAAVAAEVFLDADLRGIGIQGFSHVHTLVRHIRTGRTDPRARPQVIRDGAATALVDGHRGLGQINGVFATDLTIAKARTAGCAVVGVVNSGDFFMAGYYAERIARAGLVGLVFSDSPPLVHPHGGTERLLGTNPLAVGIPTDGDDPIVHDMATSALAASRVRQAAYHDKELPAGCGVNRYGSPTNNAAEIRDGAIAPLAGYKGFGLALSIALLSGPLVGAFCGRALDSWMTEEPGQGASRGQLFIGIDPAAFGDPALFRKKVGLYRDEIKRSRKAPGVDAIRMPGERAFAMRRGQQSEGHVAVYDDVWDRSIALARDLGIDAPFIE